MQNLDLMIGIILCNAAYFSFFRWKNCVESGVLTIILGVAPFYFLWYSFDMSDYGKRVDVCCD